MPSVPIVPLYIYERSVREKQTECGRWGLSLAVLCAWSPIKLGKMNSVYLILVGSVTVYTMCDSGAGLLNEHTSLKYCTRT